MGYVAVYNMQNKCEFLPGNTALISHNVIFIVTDIRASFLAKNAFLYYIRRGNSEDYSASILYRAEVII
jgi:hypothetical protein